MEASSQQWQDCVTWSCKTFSTVARGTPPPQLLKKHAQPHQTHPNLPLEQHHPTTQTAQSSSSFHFQSYQDLFMNLFTFFTKNSMCSGGGGNRKVTGRGRLGVRRLKVVEEKKLYLETFSSLFSSVKKKAYVLKLFDKLVFIFKKQQTIRQI